MNFSRETFDVCVLAGVPTLVTILVEMFLLRGFFFRGGKVVWLVFSWGTGGDREVPPPPGGQKHQAAPPLFLTFWAARCYSFGLALFTMLAVSKQGLGLTPLSRAGVYHNDLGASALGMVLPKAVAPSLAEWVKVHSSDTFTRPAGKIISKKAKAEAGAKPKPKMKDVVEVAPLDLHLLNYLKSNRPDAKQFIVLPTLLEHTGTVTSSDHKRHMHGRGYGSIDEFFLTGMKFSSLFKDVDVGVMERRIATKPVNDAPEPVQSWIAAA